MASPRGFTLVIYLPFDWKVKQQPVWSILNMVAVHGVQKIRMKSWCHTAFGLGGDGLASVRVRAVLGIEVPGSIGQGYELQSCRLEVLYVPVEILKVALQEIDHVVARALACTAKVQDGGDFREGQSCRLRVPNEAQPRDSVLAVVAIPVERPFGFGQQPNLLVETNRLGRDVRTASEFSDFHTKKYTPKWLDIPVG